MVIILNIRETFLGLTQYTCPHGNESMYDNLLDGIGCQRDAAGNSYLDIGESTTSFACHLDTADSGAIKRVSHEYWGDDLVATDNKTILGADDKAGMTVLLWLIHHKIPGHYVFFVGEERGRIGSRKYEMPEHITKIICFDRYGYTDLITHQMSERTCSNEFANELAEQLGLGHVPSREGSYTDSYSFIDSVPECTNIAIGYDNAHLPQEFQDLTFLERMCYAVLDVKWDELPVKRDPTKQEFDGSYGWYKKYNFSKTSTLSYDADIVNGVIDGSITYKELKDWVDQYPHSATALIQDLILEAGVYMPSGYYDDDTEGNPF